MRKNTATVLLILAAASAATASPLGLSGFSAGIGAGGLTDGYIQGEYDFTLSQYICLGPEFILGFGGGGALYAGCAGRFYVIPDFHEIFQPHLAFGVGVAHGFDKEDTNPDEGKTGVYINFAPGCDFDIPKAPISPYVDLGGLFFAGDDTEADFKVEVGARFNI